MSLTQSFADTEARLAKACAAAARARGSVALLAVSKTQSAETIAAAAALGQRAFGENYVQEALPKMAALASLKLEWHHIGPIQSNKTADIATHFDWAHGVDRLKIAQRLSEQRPPHQLPLQICVQVNISNEASKSGCDPAALPQLCDAIAQLPGLRLRGLMAIPDALQSDAPFAAMRLLFEQVSASHPGIDTLSMGMSGDLEHAVRHGSTMVRIGSALFGSRPTK